MTTYAYSSSTPINSALSKVPLVTAAFWIIKVFATTVGETAADFLNETLGFGLTSTSLVMTVLLVVALVLQFRASRYVPAIYWTAIVVISVVGTLISDNLVDNLGVPLWATTLIFGVLLAAAFIFWFMVEGTLSIHSIRSTRREAFYWAAVLFAFALGTSAGDLIGEGLNLGYPLSLALFAAAIALVAAAYAIFHLNAVLAFWIAYVLTRPLGASAGDLLSQPVTDGGLGLGTSVTSAVFLVVIVTLVVILTVRERRGIRQLPSKA